MEDVLPPPFHDEFWDEDRDDVVVPPGVDLVDELEDRPGELAVGGVDDVEGAVEPVGGPGLLDALLLLLVGHDGDGHEVVGIEGVLGDGGLVLGLCTPLQGGIGQVQTVLVNLDVGALVQATLIVGMVGEVVERLRSGSPEFWAFISEDARPSRSFSWSRVSPEAELLLALALPTLAAEPKYATAAVSRTAIVTTGITIRSMRFFIKVPTFLQ